MDGPRPIEAVRPDDPGDAPDAVREVSEEGDLSAVLRAAAGGDQGAWRVVIERYSRRVYAMAKSRVRSPELAEEVAQSVFATVAAKLGSGGYQEQGRFESWLFRVVMNRVRDEARRMARQALPTDPALMPGGGAASGGVNAGASPLESRAGLDGGVLAALRAALASLPDQDREVIELRHHGQMSFKAMADLLQEPLGTLLARHHRALRKLHGLLAGVEGLAEAGIERSGPRGAPGAPGASRDSGVSKGGRHHGP